MPLSKSQVRPRAVSAIGGLLVTLALGASGCFCGGSPGVLAGVGPDARFVTEATTLYVTGSGIRSVALDGTGARTIFAGHYTVLDVSMDLDTWLLSDSETNLVIGDAKTGATRVVPALAKRVSDAALSPDGSRIAASRHSDFSLPQKQWEDDDSIFLVDAKTLDATQIPAASKDWPTGVQWSADGKALWLSMAFNKPSQWLTIADGARQSGLTAPPAPLRAGSRVHGGKCEARVTTEKFGIEISIADTPGATPRVLVRLEGRKRGMHDYQADFHDPVLSPGCKYVVFGHRNRIYAADVRTGTLGPVADGSLLFFQR